MEDRCVCCGEIIPEGRQICINCENNDELRIDEMDEKKVREAIDFIKTLIAAGNGDERLYTAIEALEKQLPKKPKHIHVNYGKHLWKKNADGSVDMEAFDGDIHGYAAECERCGRLAFYEELLEGDDCEVDKYYCPSCNCRVRKGENVCKCGQLLKWEK